MNIPSRRQIAGEGRREVAMVEGKSARERAAERGFSVIENRAIWIRCGNAFRLQREAYGLTQEAMAGRLRVSVDNLAAFERGEIANRLFAMGYQRALAKAGEAIRARAAVRSSEGEPEKGR